jgi:23S rRNA pseudouridine1911/1915/1917 synthase
MSYIDPSGRRQAPRRIYFSDGRRAEGVDVTQGREEERFGASGAGKRPSAGGDFALREAVNEGPSDRLDRVLARAFPDLSRARIQDLIKQGQARIDGAPASSPSAKAQAGARVSLAVPPAAPPEPEGENIPLDIVHEDEDLVVLDKPAGLVVHPAGGHETGTLVNALIAHCGESLSGIGGVRRPGIVHRLDKDTSGLLVVAKNDRAHRGLAEQFADHGRTGPLERAYLAVAWGVPDRPRLTIDAPIERAQHNREKMQIVKPGRGREAITHVELLETFAREGRPVASLLRCRLETGRTHQIRVHLAHRGHPLLGDKLYGSGFKSKEAQLDDDSRAALAALSRQALHAALLGFEHPASGEEMHFERDPPADLSALLDALRAMR